MGTLGTPAIQETAHKPNTHTNQIQMDKKLSEKTQDEILEDAFRQADKNGDGKISFEEIITIFKAADICWTPAEVRAAFFSTDADQSGNLDLAEFDQFCASTNIVCPVASQGVKNKKKLT